MRTHYSSFRAGFTLVEVLISIAILSAILGAVYSSWSGILKAKQVAIQAAASVQRERMAMRVVEEALSASQLFAANVGYYGFSNETALGEGSSVSVVARLPKSFPRSGKFGQFDVRRVTFSVEPGPNGQKQLLMRQNPILMAMDDDEKSHPVLLADAVNLFTVEYWDNTKNDWVDEWGQTNQLPKLARVSMQLNYVGVNATRVGDLIVREVGFPTAGVPQQWQVPVPAANPSTGRGRMGVIDGPPAKVATGTEKNE